MTFRKLDNKAFEDKEKYSKIIKRLKKAEKRGDEEELSSIAKELGIEDNPLLPIKVKLK